MSAAPTRISTTPPGSRWPLTMAVALALAACSQQTASPGPTTVAAPTERTGQPDLARLGLEELRSRGRLALREQRIYTPAGNNAMEYYIALRDGSERGDDPAASALMELQPYAVIAAEQALAREDFDEAERLRRLVAASDPRAPSLARIASAIANGLGNRARDQRQDELAADEAQEAVAAAPALAPTAVVASDAPVPIVTPIVAPRVAPIVAPASTPTAAVQAAAPPAVAVSIAAPVTKPTRAELVAVRTPPPEYPNEKRRQGTVGRVVASFTVNSDGTVGEIRTESIGSPQLAFERSVTSAVRRWKYQPPGESRDVTLSFNFAP